VDGGAAQSIKLTILPKKIEELREARGSVSSQAVASSHESMTSMSGRFSATCSTVVQWVSAATTIGMGSGQISGNRISCPYQEFHPHHKSHGWRAINVANT
jgi:hypothetical protein